MSEAALALLPLPPVAAKGPQRQHSIQNKLNRSFVHWFIHSFIPSFLPAFIIIHELVRSFFKVLINGPPAFIQHNELDSVLTSRFVMQANDALTHSPCIFCITNPPKKHIFGIHKHQQLNVVYCTGVRINPCRRQCTAGLLQIAEASTCSLFVVGETEENQQSTRVPRDGHSGAALLSSLSTKILRFQFINL